MIELSFSTAFTLYLAFTFGIILSIWIYSHYKERHQFIVQPEQDLCICEYCHYAYLAKSHIAVNRCPQCNSLNKANRYQDLKKEGH